jgi:hypothetical protein
MASKKRSRKHRPGPHRPPGRVVVARQVLLTDAAGNVRMRLGCAEDGSPYLLLMGPDGRARVELGACGGAGQVQLLDAQGRPRVVVQNGPEEVSAVTLLDGRGELSAGLHSCGGASGVLALSDATGRKGAGLQVTPAGELAELARDELHGGPEVRGAGTPQEERHHGQPGRN